MGCGSLIFEARKNNKLWNNGGRGISWERSEGATVIFRTQLYQGNTHLSYQEPRCYGLWMRASVNSVDHAIKLFTFIILMCSCS